ncbi:DUF4870 domain-containing protein [Aureivirga marina]|uniref:DUF4870 domain-containing protein n=1 Tax=Aureivirga marina TaxID=1182451 RepID=UPI0018CACA4E|nr:DUF4870 domain-containing protein [Aureivirga marina]
MEENSSVKKEIAIDGSSFKPWGMELKQYLLLMHLSQLGGMIVPFAGLILPIVMWITNKDNDPKIDEHGKNIMNFIISCVIYATIGLILTFVIIGIFVLFAVGVIAIVFPIIGAVKASNGDVYKYPLAIRFFK